MTNIIEQLGFYRLVHVSDNQNLSDDELAVVEQAKEFDIDSVYFCKDEKRSYPALFLKKVTEFDNNTLKTMAEIQRKIWNYKKILFLYVYTDTEIRIYNCVQKPLIKKSNTDYSTELSNFEIMTATNSDTKKLNVLYNLFSAIAIDTGIIWTLEEASKIRERINIKTRVDKYLVTSLINTTTKLLSAGLDISIVHKLMLRSLFLLYLEDRGATDSNFYGEIKPQATSYFEILNDVKYTYELYGKLEHHFNGSLFAITDDEYKKVKDKHLQLIKNCFTYGDDGSNQDYLPFGERIFDFKIIQIELLSEIYESFLAAMEPGERHQTGTFYTPPPLVEFILNEKLPIDSKEKVYNIKILDPACGSGIFLVESFKRLIKRHENSTGKKLTYYDELKNLLLDNIYGIDINLNSLKVAAFSLYLALLENLDPKTLWQKKELPYLIYDKDDDTQKQGKNLFHLDAIEKNDVVEGKKYDLIVGNPPFGTEKLLNSISDYCNKFNFAKEQVLPFLHKATVFSPDGNIALIFNAKILTNNLSTYMNFRKWLFESCYVERIYNFSILRKAPKNFGGQLFNSSASPVCIIFFKKETPARPSNKIVYYAPKTFIKSNILDGIVIDSSDVKYLPREECRKPDTKIWKIAMWGGEGDINLINNLGNQLSLLKIKTIKQFMDDNSIKSGVGFGLLTHDEEKEPHVSDELSNMGYLDADSITRYYTPEIALKEVTASLKREKTRLFYMKMYNAQDVTQIKAMKHFRRLGDMDAYESPHLVIKKGLGNNKLCASYIDFDCSFKDGVYGFYSKDSEILKVLTAYFNSKLSTYFIFMTNSSYGIEREQIMKDEYLSIPINLAEKEVQKILTFIADSLNRLKKDFPFTDTESTPEIANEIDTIIYESLGLTEKDRIILTDTIENNLELFHNKENSQALRPIKDTVLYAKMICTEINDFLEWQNLYANATVYSIPSNVPIVMLKLSFNSMKNKYTTSNENISMELERINQALWKQQGGSIYFRKKLNYYDGDDVYIIRPNQKRFWTRSAAIDDAAEIIHECLNGS